VKFVVDAQLPTALCDWLKARGHEAVHVKWLSKTPLSDEEIVGWGAEHCSIVVSKDADFPPLCRESGLLWLRCGNLATAALLAWLEPQWNQAEARLLAGEAFVELN